MSSLAWKISKTLCRHSASAAVSPACKALSRWPTPVWAKSTRSSTSDLASSTHNETRRSLGADAATVGSPNRADHESTTADGVGQQEIFLRNTTALPCERVCGKAAWYALQPKNQTPQKKFLSYLSLTPAPRPRRLRPRSTLREQEHGHGEFFLKRTQALSNELSIPIVHRSGNQTN